MRIQKFIASTGTLSRRKAEEAIIEGRVEVNSKIITELGTKINPDQDEIKVDGKILKTPEKLILILFHKPRQVMTTKFDPQNRVTIMNYLPPELQHVKPIGRLDYDSEGLLLLTNDGDLANKIAHPSFGIKKTYEVWIKGDLDLITQQQMKKEIVLEDGPGKLEDIKLIETIDFENESIYEVTVSEGRNRFIRRIFEHVHAPVLRLKRIQIGDFYLNDLPIGRFQVQDL